MELMWFTALVFLSNIYFFLWKYRGYFLSLRNPSLVIVFPIHIIKNMSHGRNIIPPNYYIGYLTTHKEPWIYESLCGNLYIFQVHNFNRVPYLLVRQKHLLLILINSCRCEYIWVRKSILYYPCKYLSHKNIYYKIKDINKYHCL